MSNTPQNTVGNADAHGKDRSYVAIKGAHSRPGALNVATAAPAAQPQLKLRSLASKQAEEVALTDIDDMTAEDAIALASKFAKQVVELGGDAYGLGTTLSLQAMKYNVAGVTAPEVMLGVAAGVTSLFALAR